jgi:hypothetical protein
MRLIAKLGKALGGLVLLLAITAFITGASLFVVGGYLVMWPVLRLSPAGQRKAAVANLLASVMQVAQAFNSTPDETDA